MTKTSKRFWDTRKVTAYSIAETAYRYIIDIEYVEPFQGGVSVKRLMVFKPKARG
jgi:hypothetical protein